MPRDPQTVVAELLGRRARLGAQPKSIGFHCPFINSTCTKRSAQNKTEPYPICSLWRNEKSTQPSEIVLVCPKRFYAVDFLKEVVSHCWPGAKPTNPQIAPEVKMEGFGNVDFVIADVADNGDIKKFLSVELQAIDITGSVFPAYHALRGNGRINERLRYGFNWDNVYKRYITQLIRKGYFHHHWNSKIVAVIPEQVYKYIVNRADFMRTADVHDPQVNIIFMTYELEDDPERAEEFRLKRVTVEGTSHANLQNAILYKKAPEKKDFETQIKSALTRAINLSDIIKSGQVPSNGK